MSEIYQASPAEQLATLRALTKRLGVIHEAQMLQLRGWALAALPWDKVRPVIRVGIDDHLVEFRVKSRKKKLKPGTGQVLTDWVAWLLGPEWVTEVNLNDAQVFRGFGREENVAGDRKVGPRKQTRKTHST